MNDIQESLARKYAQAFMNVYAGRIEDDMAERILALSNYIQEHKRALFYVQLTVLDGDETKKNFDALFVSAGLDHIFAPLIDLLLEHGRIVLLPRIMRFMYSLYLEKQNTMKFIIESPVELTSSELSSLERFLEKKTGKRIRYQVRINPDLIAGIKFYSDTLGFEQSIRKNLRMLSATT